MNKKNLLSLSKNAAKSCFINNKLDEKKALNFAQTFNKLPLDEAIFTLTQFKKNLVQILSQHILIIESTLPLSSSQISHIKKIYQQQYLILDIKNIINTSLLGGVKVRIGTNVFDDSIKSKITSLKGAING